MNAPAPGWYPDPTAPGTQRYWDGAAWTDSTAPMPGFVAPAPEPAPVVAQAPTTPPPAYAPPPPGYATPAYSRADMRPAPQVGFVEAIKLGFRKYGTFAGRATRAEYWWWYLFTIVIFLPLYVVALVALTVATPSTSSSQLGTTSTTTSAGAAGVGLILSLVLLVVALALFVPSISVLVRRLHDTDKSGWWYWISLVPFVGGIILIVLLVMESTPGPNRYGPPSRGAADL